jgi:sulfur-oxidizing protein SoxX
MKRMGLHFHLVSDYCHVMIYDQKSASPRLRSTDRDGNLARARVRQIDPRTCGSLAVAVQQAGRVGTSIRGLIFAGALAGMVLAIPVASALASAAFPPLPEQKLVRAGFSAAPAPAQACVAQPAELAAYETSSGQSLAFAINDRLAGHSGNADRGAVWAADPAHGNCIACHQTPGLAQHISADEPRLANWVRDHGNLGPSLAGVSARYSEGELRLLIVNPRLALPDTVMPAYHRVAAQSRLPAPCAGQPLLSAQQVEDIVAFLLTQGEPAPVAK